MGSVCIAGVQRGYGFSYMISTGNESVLDMADAIDFLAGDGATQAICLIVEMVRRPQAFFAAVARARSVSSSRKVCRSTVTRPLAGSCPCSANASR